MPLRLLRQIFSVLLVVAYVGATMIAVAPDAKAAPAAMHGMTMQAEDGTGGTMPMRCKSMKPGCVTDAGCIFMVSLPAPPTALGTSLAWVSVYYPMAAETVPGHTIMPLLGPPISRA
jgi:hypothetical protein